VSARLRDVDAAAANGTLAQLDTVIETAAAEKTLSTLLEDRAKQAAAPAAASWRWLTGCSSAVFDEVPSTPTTLIPITNRIHSFCKGLPFLIRRPAPPGPINLEEGAAAAAAAAGALFRAHYYLPRIEKKVIIL
jgi:hypothetical protein